MEILYRRKAAEARGEPVDVAPEPGARQLSGSLCRARGPASSTGGLARRRPGKAVEV